MQYTSDPQPSPTLTSDGQGWSGLTLHQYEQPSSAVELPALARHRFGLHLAGRTLLENTCDGRQVVRWSDGGHISFIPAGLPVKRSFKGHPSILEIYLETVLVDDASAEMFDCDPRAVCLKPLMVVQDDTSDRLARLMLSEARAQAPGGRLAAEALGRALVVQLLRCCSNRAPQVARDPAEAVAGWRLRRVVDYMQSNLAEDMSLAQLAAVCGLGPSQFVRAFRAAANMPPHQFLIKLRVERAQEMLEQTTIPITEVGLHCGFMQPNHFATMFRRVTGLSPRAYRQARQL